MYDQKQWGEAVMEAMDDHGFKGSSDSSGGILWDGENMGSNLVLRVERELGGEDLLFVGDRRRPGEFYLFEDVIWRWGEEWGESRLKGELQSLVDKTIRYVENPVGDPPKPALTLSRSLELLEAHRDKLEEMFSPERIDGTIGELSGLKEGILRDAMRRPPAEKAA